MKERPGRWKVLWYMICYPGAFWDVSMDHDIGPTITHELLARVKTIHQVRCGRLFNPTGRALPLSQKAADNIITEVLTMTDETETARLRDALARITYLDRQLAVTDASLGATIKTANEIERNLRDQLRKLRDQLSATVQAKGEATAEKLKLEIEVARLIKALQNIAELHTDSAAFGILVAREALAAGGQEATP